MIKKGLLYSLITALVVFVSTGGAAALVNTPANPTSALQQLGTGFSYQGYLEDQSGPVTDSCDFRFSLFGSSDGVDQVGTTQTVTDVAVENGYFIVPDLDFGAGVFQGDSRFLEVEVSCPAGSGSYTTLDPRQPISPAPYALALPGFYTLPGGETPNLVGGYSGNWISDGAWGATISGGGVSWGNNRVTDHVGTVGGGANNQAGNDDGDVGNADGATVGGGWDNTARGAVSTVGGGGGNYAGGISATVAGGSDNAASGEYNATVGGGYNNSALESDSTVGGGSDNFAGAWAATIGGGNTNTITSTGAAATIGGGFGNIASGQNATVGGGDSNTASGDWNATIAGGAVNLASADESTIGGGAENTASNTFTTVGGGYQNTANGFGATVPGGLHNHAGGDFSFAAGENAHAHHTGAFVWADASGVPYTSTLDNQFSVRATGGVNFETGGAPFQVNGIEVGSASYANVVVVAKSGGDFTSIQAALDSITDADVSNPYLVWVAPGVYTERVTMKEYVDIEGAGEKATKITYTGFTNRVYGTVIGADNAELRYMTIENTGGDQYAIPIFIQSLSSTTLKFLTLTASGGTYENVGIVINNASPTIRNVRVLASESTYATGIEIENDSSPQIMDVTIIASGAEFQKGIDVSTSNLSIMDSVISVSEGSWIKGFEIYSSTLMMNNVEISTSNGITLTRGIDIHDTQSTIRNSYIRSIGSTDNFGIWVYNSISPGLVKIFNSQITSSDNTIYCTGNPCTVVVGTTHLSGKTVSPASGTVTCAGVYDENFTFYADSCP